MLAVPIPGPWKVELDVLSGFFEIRYSSGRCIALVDEDEYPEEHGAAIAFANARLIAAAPDLLEACTAAREAINWSHGHRLLNHVELAALEKLEAAIAKAEGRASDGEQALAAHPSANSGGH